MKLLRRCMTIFAQPPPWLMAVFFTLVFLAINGYKFGWDDQHLEIPLLKHLIDPALYFGDYYVESLAENFTSFFYPILARLISVEQVQPTYLLLYIISRYFLLYWIYKLWLHLSQDRFKATACVLTFILMARVQEFLYRTFSHQEFALAIIFAGIYYFFRERYFLAALILGLAANFHALYSLFPMFYIGIYLLWDARKLGWKKFIGVPMVYVLAASPFLIWTVMNKLKSSGGVNVPFDQWFALYVTACPQNFFFPQLPNIPWRQLVSEWNVFYYFFQSYIHLVALLLLNLFFNPLFNKNKRALAFCLGGFVLLGMTFVFTYISPNRFILDLNLIRTTQYLSFLLMGFTTILLIDTVVAGKIITGLIFGVLFAFLKYNYPIMSSAVGLMAIVLLWQRIVREGEMLNGVSRRLLKVLLFLFCAAFLGIILHAFYTNEFSLSIRVHILLIFVLLIANYAVARFFENKRPELLHLLKSLFVAIPLMVFFSQYSVYHYRKANMELKGDGFWKLQRSWEDMQRYVRRYTPKDALIFVPYNMEMCGFRIQSERKVLVSYRDCGIVGFDYAAAEEWKRRIADVHAYKVFPDEPVVKALQNAIVKYKTDYIVFLRRLAPEADNNLWQRIYTNEEFVLFKVRKP